MHCKGRIQLFNYIVNGVAGVAFVLLAVMSVLIGTGYGKKILWCALSACLGFLGIALYSIHASGISNWLAAICVTGILFGVFLTSAGLLLQIRKRELLK